MDLNVLEVEQIPTVTSVWMGIASRRTIALFNDIVSNHGSILKALEELLTRQSNQKTDPPFTELEEENEEWFINASPTEDALLLESALQDLDRHVMRNGLKDRPSGIEDLLLRDVDVDESGTEMSVLREERTSNAEHVQDKVNRFKSGCATILLLIDTSNISGSEICSFCQECFESRNELEYHVCEKHGAEQIIDSYDNMECPLCDELLDSKTMLQEHCRQEHLRHVSYTSDGNMKLSAGELSKCPQCDYVALRKGRMSTHLKKVHQIVEDIACDVCRKAFSSHRAMLHHFQQMHTMINSTCNICGKVCKNRAAYQNHNLTHSRTFQCRYCSKVFNNRRCYTQHEKHHLTKAAHLCNYCGQRFSMKSNLDRHVKITHLKEGKLNCDLCSFSTFYKDNMRVHVNKVHLGIDKGKFVCHACGKNFSRRLVFEEHMDKHEGRYRYTCQYCGKKYRNKARCKQHFLQCGAGKLNMKTLDVKAETEASRLCVDDDVTPSLPDPDNLSLMVEFVQSADAE